ncbi:hypothetical protein LZ31DRAFT_268007 [Colletotrichum somersetense]|nr:hypothetical protein LZ31DRAFT_268007 [Colletotrichum somersetense]
MGNTLSGCAAAENLEGGRDTTLKAIPPHSWEKPSEMQSVSTVLRGHHRTQSVFDKQGSWHQTTCLVLVSSLVFHCCIFFFFASACHPEAHVSLPESYSRTPGHSKSPTGSTTPRMGKITYF